MWKQAVANACEAQVPRFELPQGGRSGFIDIRKWEKFSRTEIHTSTIPLSVKTYQLKVEVKLTGSLPKSPEEGDI